MQSQDNVSNCLGSAQSQYCILVLSLAFSKYFVNITLCQKMQDVIGI